ncbi:hypothetical protein ANN_06281 [Periplaneta americana]|uniref:Uncharacterized protein n=1 Tax=Periplaneta americana TaxID=6978 RepID=A0ABQ8TD75_PERAM|nr:hypothetical protein ANN_06281 [Periplaneta americana]
MQEKDGEKRHVYSALNPSSVAESRVAGEHAMVNMWTPQQKVQCVLWLAEEKSVTRVQHSVRRTWNVDLPGHKAILKRHTTLRETGSLLPQTGKHAKRKNDAETDQKEETELVESLAEKKLPAEGCTGRNGEREKNSRQKMMSDDRRY